MMSMRNCFRGLAILLIILLAASAAFAGDYPNKPIKLIVGFKAGGGTDSFARAFAKVAPKYLNNQPVVVVNKPGAGGLIGGRFVADQPPTGYILYMASTGSMILKNLIKPQVVGTKDFKAAGTIGDNTGGVFVPASSPIKTLDELIAKLKDPSQKMRWGHTGRGNVWHVAGLGLMQKHNLKAQDIPFKGGSGVRSALIGEQVDFGIIGSNLGVGFEKDMRMLAVLSDQRNNAAGDIPSIEELGIDYVKVTSPNIIMAPKRVKPEIVDYLSAKILEITNDPEYKQLLTNAGLTWAQEDAATSEQSIAAAKAAYKPLVER